MCLILFSLGSVLTVGARVDRVDEDEEPLTFIAGGGGADALHTLIWRVQSALLSSINVAIHIASGTLRVGWSVLALATLLTRVLSSFSLLVMLGVR